MTNTTEYILKANCPAACGIVAGVSGFLAERGCYISELSHFDDKQNANLFMRTRFHIDNGDATQESIQEEFQAIADKFSMDWHRNYCCCIQSPRLAPHGRARRHSLYSLTRD